MPASPTSRLSDHQRRALASGRWFAGLPAPLQQALCRHAWVVTRPQGALLFRRGDEGNGLYAVLDGAIRFGAFSAAGRESVVGLAQPGQWFGEVALLDGDRRSHDAWAESDTTLAHVSLPALADWLAQHPADWRHLGQLAMHKLRVMFAHIEDASLHTPRERLIRCLVLLSSTYGQRAGRPRLTLRVSQERLGSMLARRQTVNALLRELQRARAGLPARRRAHRGLRALAEIGGAHTIAPRSGCLRAGPLLGTGSAL